MAIEVAKVILKHVQDASGLEERILAGQFSADDVVAVIGKTEGNGGVNDFTRILADNAFRAALAKHGKRSAEAIRGRSEERRVGKECRSRWSWDQVKEKRRLIGRTTR